MQDTIGASLGGRGLCACVGWSRVSGRGIASSVCDNAPMNAAVLLLLIRRPAPAPPPGGGKGEGGGIGPPLDGGRAPEEDPP